MTDLEYARLRFAYNRVTGEIIHCLPPLSFFGSVRCQNIFKTKYVGKPASVLGNRGYFHTIFRGRKIVTHRIIWLMAHGEWPNGEIDHINGNPLDNRIANLRDVTASLNRMNQRQRSDNSSGVTGVMFHKGHGKWIAQICVAGRRRQVGGFNSRDDAICARLASQDALPFGPNHGRRA